MSYPYMYLIFGFFALFMRRPVLKKYSFTFQRILRIFDSDQSLPSEA